MDVIGHGGVLKELISKLTWADYLALVALLRGLYVGYKSGFFPELLRIAAYLATVIVAFQFQEPLAQYLILNTFLNQAMSRAVALAGLLSGVFLVTKLLRALLLKLLKVGEGGLVNRLIGAAMGGCRWLVLLSLIFMLVDYLPLGPLKTDIHTRSMTGPRVVRVAPVLFDFLSSLSPQLALPKKAA